MSTALDIGAGLAGGIGSGIIGLALGKQYDERQYEQQERLQALQIKGQKEMAEYAQKQQLENWEATGYGAQMKQLEKAGLNPGLLYGLGGGGGQSMGAAPSTSVTGGTSQGSSRQEVQQTAGMGIQMALLQAQKENIEADTKLKNADATKTAGIDTVEAGARVDNLMQGLDNLREDYEIKRLQQTMMNIENYEKQASQGDRLNYIEYQTGSALRNLQTLKNEGKISDNTVQEKISIVKNEAIYSMLKNELTKGQTEKTLSDVDVNKQKIKESIQNLMMSWENLSNDNRKIQLQRIMTDYNTTIDPWTKEGLDILEQAVDGVLRKK